MNIHSFIYYMTLDLKLAPFSLEDASYVIALHPLTLDLKLAPFFPEDASDVIALQPLTLDLTTVTVCPGDAPCDIHTGGKLFRVFVQLYAGLWRYLTTGFVISIPTTHILTTPTTTPNHTHYHYHS